MNALTTWRRRCRANIPINTSVTMNALTMQRCKRWTTNTLYTMWLYMINSVISCTNLRQMTLCFAVFYTIKWRKSFYASLSTTPTFLITPPTTPSISMANHSPLSSENHRSLFVKPAKRGKQRAGGEALFPFLYSTKWLGVRLQITDVSALSPTPPSTNPTKKWTHSHLFWAMR